MSANHPDANDPPAAGNVISGVTFDINSTGTFVAPTAAENATAVWDSLTAALTTANSIGKRLADNVDEEISVIKTDVAAVKADTNIIKVSVI